MSDKPESTKRTFRKIEGKKKEAAPPPVKRGEEIQIEGHPAVVYGILYDGDRDPGPNGYQIGVVFLEGNRGMATLAQWSESRRCWKFIKNEIPRDTRPALDELVQKLRFRRVK